jgi:hypothetical protein
MPRVECQAALRALGFVAVDPTTALYHKLEFASFSQREQIADEVVRDQPELVASLVRGLEHPHENVRLGVIEILRRAHHRDGMRELLAHARGREGDDRVFAMRALAQLAQPGDDFLVDSVRGWLTLGDPFIAIHATKLASVLDVRVNARGRAVAAKPAKPAEPAREVPANLSLDKLVVELFSASKSADKLALVDAIEKRGPQALAAAAKLILQKGNADLVAYICRAVIRQAAAMPDGLTALLEAARRRLGDEPIANAAIDDAVMALGGAQLSPALLARLADVDPGQLDKVATRFIALPPEEAGLQAPKLLDAIARKPALWSSLGPALAYAAPHVRESTRAELRRLTEVVLDDLRQGKPLPPVTVVSATWVLARTCERGEPLSKQLRVALDRLAVGEAARALCALCARLQTEEAAAVVLAMLRDPLPAARDAAREVVQAWQSPWVQLVEPGTEWTLTARYDDTSGQPLARRGDKLVTEGGEEYVLDGRGRPTRGGETEAGGCLCCAPPRMLARRRGEGLRCPSTWESHLRDGGRTLLERDHALGRCKKCESARPRVREGARIVCLDCGAGVATDSTFEPDPGQHPTIPSEHGRGANDDTLPKPPTREELEHVAPRIRAAIGANVFLHARERDQTWNGSGIIIARDGNHVAILTNRHVVESDDQQRWCAMKALTVSGETIAVTGVWRARRGVDLALVEGRLANPDAIGVMPLGTGAAVVGAEVFAIGNPLGLAWSYSKGTLSAIRRWTTQDNLQIKILQTDTNTAPGSSGGGLFHGDGHLIGVVSFGRQGSSGGSAHFAISIEAIREAFSREGVTWHGQTLAELA